MQIVPLEGYNQFQVVRVQIILSSTLSDRDIEHEEVITFSVYKARESVWKYFTSIFTLCINYNIIITSSNYFQQQSITIHYLPKYNNMKFTQVQSERFETNVGHFTTTSSSFDDTKYYSSPKFIFGQGRTPTRSAVNTPKQSNFFLPIPCTVRRDMMKGGYNNNASPPFNTYHRSQNERFGANSGQKLGTKGSSLDDSRYYSSQKFIFGQGRDPAKEPAKPAVKNPNPSKFFLPIPWTVRRDMMMVAHGNNGSAPSHMYDPRASSQYCIPRPSSPSQINPFGRDYIAIEKW